MSNLFDNKAEGWDTRTIPQQLSATIGPAIIEHVDLNPNMEVLDFGAGTGLLTAHIAPLVKHVSAVDISQSMLDQLIAKPELEGKVTAYCQNILEKPLEKSFDLIVSAMAMHHVEHTREMLQAFSKHLKPGARVALADLDTEDGSFHPAEMEGIFHFGFDRDTFTTLLNEVGIKDVKFLTAHIIETDGKDYPVFLVLGQKA
ncbi:MAG: class I SAM-dependent methyltransferase [Thiovulaceae bacterium]|nr:class I SAM-dependent methyltransferase [Sulfurimonadaceae bacterium]